MAQSTAHMLIKQGLQQGIQKSMQQGLQKGVKQEKFDTAMRMKKKGYAKKDIAEMTGLSLKEIKQL